MPTSPCSVGGPRRGSGGGRHLSTIFAAASFIALLLLAVLHSRFWSVVLDKIGQFDALANCELPPHESIGLCRSLHAQGCARRIAVVGNGPLTDEQRRDINDFDRVIRFNALNNWLCNDRIDVWLTRQRDAPDPATGHAFHGLGALELCTSGAAVRALSALWLLGELSAAQSAFNAFPGLRGKEVAAVDEEHWRQVYRQAVSDGLPSSGWTGLMLALTCTPADGEVHVFGFNWAKGLSLRYNMYAEQAFIDALDAAGKVVVHPPPCDGLRDCEGCFVLKVTEDGATQCVEEEAGAAGDVPRQPKENEQPQALASLDLLDKTELSFLVPRKQGERKGRLRAKRRPREPQQQPAGSAQ